MSKSLRTEAAVFALYAGLAILITWPLVTELSTHLAGYDFSDAREMTRNIWWMKFALQTGQPLAFQTYLGYPDGFMGVPLWAQPLQQFPAWLFAFVMPLPAAYNTMALLTLALNGWSVFWLTRYLTGQMRPAVLAGVVFLAAPTIQGHLAGGHLGPLVQWPLAGFVYALLRLVDQSGWRPFGLALLFFLLTAFTHTLQVIYALLPLLVVFSLRLLLRGAWPALRRVVAVSAVGGILLGLYLLPVAEAALTTDAYLEAGGSVGFSLDLLAVVTPSFNHPLSGELDYPARVLGVNIVEGAAYIGIIPAGLGALAAWKRREARWLLALLGLAWVLALGPLLKVFDSPVTVNIDGYSTQITLPWLLAGDLPILNLARTPARFSFVMALAVALLAGYGAHQMARLHRLTGSRPLVGWAGVALACAVIVFDYQSFWPMPTRSAHISDGAASLAERQDVRAVFNIPWDNLLAAKDAVYLQTAHQRPMVAGQVTRVTPVNPARLALLQATLDPALLKAAGADVVIVHHTYDKNLAAFASAQLGEPVYKDGETAIYAVPPAQAAPGFAVVGAPQDAAANSANFYVHMPEDGWVRFSGGLDADGRAVSLLVDDVRVHWWRGEAFEIDLSVPVRAGYHSLALAAEPLCPAVFDSALACRALRPEALVLSNFVPASLDAVATFERGIRLAAASPLLPVDNSLRVGLLWAFEQARSSQDVRFVHVVDAAGEVAAQDDRTLGEQTAGGQWLEQVSISLEGVPPGEYRVYTGWYAFPDTTPFPADAAPDGRLLIGVVSKQD